MLYTILRPTTRIVLQGYYRKIFVNGQEKIPGNQPVILAVNHPSAFTEPCVLATHLDRELHFLIRGDIINPNVKWFFDQTNQLPIYRFRDGFSGMRQNEKQFSYCFDLLARSGCIAIFAEGSTRHIKQTRPIQKGAARIAFGALQNREIEDVWIVPVGVNFEHSPRPRSMVAVEVGEPISTREYLGIYEEDDRLGLKNLTDRIFQGLNSQMIHIAQGDRLDVANDVLLMASHDLSFRSYPVAEYGESTYFDYLAGVAKKVNQLTDIQWNEFSDLNQQYKNKLQSAEASDIGGSVSDMPGSFMRDGYRSKTWWILMTPLALLGWVFLGPIYWIAFTIQKRLNQKDEYISGFRMAGFLVFVPVFIILWMIFLSPYFGWWILTFPVLLPVLSMVAVLWLDKVKWWKKRIRWKNLPIHTRNELLELRNRIMNLCKS